MALSPTSSRAASGTVGGDLSGTLPNPTVAQVNGIAVSGTPSTGYVPTATGAAAATWQAAAAGGVTVLSYVEVTSSLTVTATTSATAQTFLTAASVTVDGSTLICVEAYCPALTNGTNGITKLNLWRDSTELGLLVYVAGNTVGAPAFVRRFLTPAAGSYVFTVRAFRATANGSAEAGDGTAAAFMPAYIRVTRGG